MIKALDAIRTSRFAAPLADASINFIEFALPALVSLYISSELSTNQIRDHIFLIGFLYSIAYLIFHLVGLTFDRSDKMKHLRDPKSHIKEMASGCWCEFYRRNGERFFAVFNLSVTGDRVNLEGWSFKFSDGKDVGTWTLDEHSLSEGNAKRRAMMIYRFWGRGTDAVSRRPDGIPVHGLGVIEFQTQDKQTGHYKEVSGSFSDGGGQPSIEFAGFRIARESVFDADQPKPGLVIKEALLDEANKTPFGRIITSEPSH